MISGCKTTDLAPLIVSMALRVILPRGDAPALIRGLRYAHDAGGSGRNRKMIRAAIKALELGQVTAALEGVALSV